MKFYSFDRANVLFHIILAIIFGVYWVLDPGLRPYYERVLETLPLTFGGLFILTRFFHAEP